MSYGTPPPPPPPPDGGVVPTSGTPWYRKPAPLFFLFLLVAAAVAIPVLFLVLGGEDEGTAASTSTTEGGVTSTGAGETTQAPGTTATTQAPPTSGTTQAPPTSGTTQAPPTSTSTSTTTTSTTTTTLPALQLDYQLDAYYEQALTFAHGQFLPDPWSYWARSGGNPAVDVSYLGFGCTGFANQAPDFDIRLSGNLPLLCVWFVADNSGDDTTLIVNTQLEEWVCNDDDAGDRNPRVRIENPENGTYDIWIASYNEGEFIDGTLYITETELACP